MILWFSNQKNADSWHSLTNRNSLSYSNLTGNGNSPPAGPAWFQTENDKSDAKWVDGNHPVYVRRITRIHGIFPRKSQTYQWTNRKNTVLNN